MMEMSDRSRSREIVHFVPIKALAETPAHALGLAWCCGRADLLEILVVEYLRPLEGTLDRWHLPPIPTDRAPRKVPQEPEIPKKRIDRLEDSLLRIAATIPAISPVKHAHAYAPAAAKATHAPIARSENM